MPRTALAFLFLLLGSTTSQAAELCGDQLQAFSLYEKLEGEEVVVKHSLFPLPENWSDASSFHGLVSDSSDATLEVTIKGKRKTFSFEPWERSPALFVAKNFHAKKFFKNAEDGALFILRLKHNETMICEERLEASGD